MDKITGYQIGMKLSHLSKVIKADIKQEEVIENDKISERIIHNIIA